MERENFEEPWKRAFNEAEISPSERVWTNIELDLERAKGGQLKRRLMFYQMLAAASVVFAMAIGGVGYYYSFQDDINPTSGLSQNQSQELQPSFQTYDADQDELVSSGDSNPSIAKSEQPSTGSKNTPDNQAFGKITDESRLLANSSDKSGNTSSVEYATPAVPQLPLQIEERELPALYTARDVTLTFDKKEQEVDPVVAMLAMLEQREREVRDDKKDKSDNEKSENLWTSVGFAAGSFNTVQAPSASGSSASPALLANSAAPIIDQESKATGYSYSVGVNVGTRLSERWVLQGGVNYLTHSSEYTANNVVADGPGFLTSDKYKPITTNAVVNADEYGLSNRIVYSAPYNVNNSMRYLSIPLQAGYLLVNKTFGLQLNAGVATDLFLQNTVKGEGDQLAAATQSGGSDSPYRTVNLSGLVGTEVSYRFGPHYRISLNPGIRYPFNTIYKSELGVQSSPLTFDVGLRFRYIFR